MERTTLYEVDFNSPEKHLKLPYVGHECSQKLRSLQEEGKIKERDVIGLYMRAKAFYIKVVASLLKTLPIRNPILRDLQVLHPIARQADWSSDAIRRLAVAIKLFPRDQIDAVVDEWESLKADPSVTSEWNPSSDVQDGCSSDEDLDLVPEIEKTVNEQRIDTYWSEIFKTKTSSGLLRYPSLSKLVKLCLTLSHGNSDVERSFSENKLLLTPTRTRMSDATLNGYRATCSFMSKYARKPTNLPLMPSLRKAVNNARANYASRIEAQKMAMKKS